MLRKSIKLFIASLITASSLLILSTSSPVSAADSPHYESFKVSGKTYYAKITFTKSSNKCSGVTFTNSKKKKLTGNTLTKIKKKAAAKTAKSKAQDWCKKQKNSNKSSTSGSTSSSSSSKSSSSSSSSSSSPAVVDTGPSDICNAAGVPDSVKAASGCNGGSNGELSGAIVSILNSIIGVSSTVAVVFIIVGGVQYMTSSGDASKVKKGKDTILYACIGLVICALAFAIVNFTIGIIGNDNSGNDNSNDDDEEALLITEKDIAFLKEKL